MTEKRTGEFIERLTAAAKARVTTSEISFAQAASADQLSLFVVVSLQARPSGQGPPLLDGRPFLLTMGFAGNWSSALTDQPRRFAGIDLHTIDRFVSFQASASTGMLATVCIREAYAYDLLYRSEIGVTGVAVQVDLHPQAADAIVKFLGTHPGFDHGPESQAGCVFRFPVPRVIRFPEPRGGEDPYSGSMGGLERLNDIATIRAASLEMAVMRRPSSPPIEWDTQPLFPLVASSDILKLSM